jgi:hypothetical protein
MGGCGGSPQHKYIHRLSQMCRRAQRAASTKGPLSSRLQMGTTGRSWPVSAH